MSVLVGHACVYVAMSGPCYILLYPHVGERADSWMSVHDGRGLRGLVEEDTATGRPRLTELGKVWNSAPADEYIHDRRV